MARSSKPGKSEPAARRSKSRNGWAMVRGFLFWLVLLTIFLPVLGVLAVRFFDPPTTTPIVLHRIDGWLTPGKTPKPDYRFVKIRKVSSIFLKCVWQAEDGQFFKHNGFDWKEMNYAVKHAQATGGAVRGASTITNQCARSLFLWQGRSWVRKVFEAYTTVLMETMLTKERILELYVNVIETGEGIYGVEAAARRYWHIDAQKLNRHQSALLTALLPNPQKRHPLRPSSEVREYAAKIEKRVGEAPSLPMGR